MIKEPMVMEIAKNTYAINEFGLSACYSERSVRF